MSSNKLFSPSPPPINQQDLDHQDLTDDVLFDIFLRLPLNAICRFRCVSKLCLSLFTSPYFLNLHFDKFVTTSCGGNLPWTLVHKHVYYYFHDKKRDQSDSFDTDEFIPSFFATSSTQHCHELIASQPGFSFGFISDSKMFSNRSSTEVFPLASSNGLLLCSLNECSHIRDYLICNPFTRQFVSLPLPIPKSGRLDLHGFVYESSTGTYKIIHIPCCNPSHNFILRIFSSDTCEWSTRQVTCSHEVKMGTYNPLRVVNYNRTWYWIDSVVRGDTMIVYNDNHNKTGSGECRRLDLPRGSIRIDGCVFSYQKCLGESEGRLCYGQIETVIGEISTISVWELQDGYDNDGSTWQIVCKDVELEDCVCGRNDYSFTAFSPVDLNVVIIDCHHDSHKYEVAYNTKTRKTEVLHSHPHHVPYCYYQKGDTQIVVTLRPTFIPAITS